MRRTVPARPAAIEFRGSYDPYHAFPAGRNGAVNFEEAVERVPFFRALAASDRERLRPYVELRRLPRSGHVWSQGDATSALTTSQ